MSSQTKCFVLMPLNYFILFMAFQFFFPQDNNLLSKLLKLFANNLSDLIDMRLVLCNSLFEQ